MERVFALSRCLVLPRVEERGGREEVVVRGWMRRGAAGGG